MYQLYIKMILINPLLFYDCFDRFVFDLVIEEMKLSRQLDDKEFVKQKYLATKELILNLLKK